ncbi:MAG TPA: FhaA domain-containing protein [Patescibacteria group bacterium]|nr:FhaA domain-containing protein [Patescibacteria group bacterium]
MPPLSGLERLLERLLERPSARLFRTHVQPIQIQHRIERVMERERRVLGDRVWVPDLYTVHLEPRDLSAFGDLAEQVAGQLADATLLYARSHGFALATRPTVALAGDPGVPVGDVRVAGSFAAGRSVADAPPVGDVTMVFEVPAMRSPSAILRAIGPDGREHDVRIDGTLLTIGRAADNGFAIDDAKVSRHHARLRARHGMLVLTDLDSTNGVRVNGVRAAEVALGVGDRIEIGDTVLVVEAVSAD